MYLFYSEILRTALRLPLPLLLLLLLLPAMTLRVEITDDNYRLCRYTSYYIYLLLGNVFDIPGTLERHIYAILSEVK